MSIFSKQKQDYHVIKLFKTVSRQEAESFNYKVCIADCLAILNRYKKALPSLYDLNYGAKFYKSTASFNTAFPNLGDIFNLACFYNDGEAKLGFSNHLLNTHDLEQSYIEISFAIEKVFLTEADIISIVSDIINKYNIDYPYALLLDEGYNFETEKKNKKSIFGIFAVISDDDLAAERMKIHYKDGYIAKVYPLNFLNPNQMKF